MIEHIPEEEILEKVDDHFTISEVKPEGFMLSMAGTSQVLEMCTLYKP